MQAGKFYHANEIVRGTLEKISLQNDTFTYLTSIPFIFFVTFPCQPPLPKLLTSRQFRENKVKVKDRTP
jgi:amino acid permease